MRQNQPFLPALCWRVGGNITYIWHIMLTNWSCIGTQRYLILSLCSGIIFSFSKKNHSNFTIIKRLLLKASRPNYHTGINIAIFWLTHAVLGQIYPHLESKAGSGFSKKKVSEYARVIFPGLGRKGP